MNGSPPPHLGAPIGLAWSRSASSERAGLLLVGEVTT
jgi:hypothetical protein